jgi:hypothetical protein
VGDNPSIEAVNCVFDRCFAGGWVAHNRSLLVGHESWLRGLHSGRSIDEIIMIQLCSLMGPHSIIFLHAIEHDETHFPECSAFQVSAPEPVSL